MSSCDDDQVDVDVDVVDRWFLYESADCSTINVGSHTTMLVIYILVHFGFLYNANRVAQTFRRKPRAMIFRGQKSVLFVILIILSLAYISFALLAMVLPFASFGVNASGAGGRAFWALWTSWIVLFMIACMLVIVVVVQGASAGTRFENVRARVRRVRAYIAIVYILLFCLLLSTFYFWTVCPLVPVRPDTLFCWRAGCLTTMLYCIVGGTTAYCFLKKLATVMLQVVLMSDSMSSTAAAARTKKMLLRTVRKIRIMAYMIIPSIISSVALWGGMYGGYLSARYYIIHIVITNSTLLIGAAWRLLFPTHTKTARQGRRDAVLPSTVLSSSSTNDDPCAGP